MLFIEYSYEQKNNKAINYWKNKVEELIENGVKNEPENDEHNLVKYYIKKKTKISQEECQFSQKR